ncbi:MAG: hypothetical protein NFCOHLIN_02814 [Gammaproteobacteria bacterium]|nr:hypothetical protein [Gammaproteobacteria bacterium]
MNALIIGCGYLGRALAARLLAAGYSVHGTVREGTGVERLRTLGVSPLVLQVGDPHSYGPLRTTLYAHGPWHVYYCVPPGTGPDPPADIARLAAVLAEHGPRRAVLASSIAVYGDRGGDSVDAATPAVPTNGRGQCLKHIEDAWLPLGGGARIVRLAGLYGPGRIIGMTTLLHGQCVAGDPEDLLNLIHVDDAAALLQAVAEGGGAATIELGADGLPLRRRDYFEHLAARLGLPCQFGRAEGTVGLVPHHRRSRACRIDPTCARTGWQPRHRDALRALDHLLALRQ